TTVAMIFGMLPLALAIGEGAEQRAPMARAVIGGLITSTLLTLLVVPVMYTILEDAVAFVRNEVPARVRALVGGRPASPLPPPSAPPRAPVLPPRTTGPQPIPRLSMDAMDKR
ncbi:MAG: efflux RND transporter permease subunit, partial [Gemmatimonadaceae bacterium]|nr:efflux RND transporter permease subunit [Gemmatimonadaceae bacterium]